MKKWMLIIVAIVIVGIIVFSFIQYRNVHTFTLTDLEAEEIQPVLGSVRYLARRIQTYGLLMLRIQKTNTKLDILVNFH